MLFRRIFPARFEFTCSERIEGQQKQFEFGNSLVWLMKSIEFSVETYQSSRDISLDMFVWSSRIDSTDDSSILWPSKSVVLWCSTRFFVPFTAHIATRVRKSRYVLPVTRAIRVCALRIVRAFGFEFVRGGFIRVAELKLGVSRV